MVQGSYLLGIRSLIRRSVNLYGKKIIESIACECVGKAESVPRSCFKEHIAIELPRIKIA
jgi:hypothetical protein